MATTLLNVRHFIFSTLLTSTQVPFDVAGTFLSQLICYGIPVLSVTFPVYFYGPVAVNVTVVGLVVRFSPMIVAKP